MKWYIKFESKQSTRKTCIFCPGPPTPDGDIIQLEWMWHPCLLKFQKRLYHPINYHHQAAHIWLAMKLHMLSRNKSQTHPTPNQQGTSSRNILQISYAIHKRRIHSDIVKQNESKNIQTNLIQEWHRICWVSPYQKWDWKGIQ